jgi:hypothetical protein
MEEVFYVVRAEELIRVFRITEEHRRRRRRRKV